MYFLQYFVLKGKLVVDGPKAKTNAQAQAQTLIQAPNARHGRILPITYYHTIFV